MQDPFGNEFCLVTLLSDEQVAEVSEAAGKNGTANEALDPHWRSLVRGGCDRKIDTTPR